MKRYYKNLRNVTTGKGDNCTARCLLLYPCFKKQYKIMPVNLNKENNLK